MVPFSLCYVDERYQGLRKHNNIKKLIAGWDKLKLNPIVIVPHPEENRFAIVDGKGRKMASEAMGIDKMDATIIAVAPEDPQERLKWEADFFIHQDDQVSKLSDGEKHLALLINEDETAMCMESIFKKYNLGIKGIHSKNEYTSKISYTELWSHAKKLEYDGLDFIFSILYNAGWNMTKNGLDAKYIRMLSRTYEFLFKERRRSFDDVSVNMIIKYLSEFLRNKEPKDILEEAHRNHPTRDERSGLPLYIQDLICGEFNIDKYTKVKISKKGTAKLVAA